ncbi:MAG: membrane protease subunit HflC [Verrucomicrobiales bacterium]|jgi:membrane protease subunit HflC
MKQAAFVIFAVVFVAIVLVVSGSMYRVHEKDQVIITEFGKPKGDPIVESGLKFKVPFIQDVNRIDRRVLEWDGRPSEMPTKDKLYIMVDTFARWQISDPLQFFLRLRDERSALSRLDDILGSETRNAVAKHDLIEMIRTTKDREVQQPEKIEGFEAARGKGISELEPISKGRSVIESDIQENAKGKLAEFGIDLLDVRFKRINYNNDVRNQIYERMISEREQIAELFRSEGAAQAARIEGSKELEMKKIQSEAYKKVQAIRGEADARAVEIYAQAYNSSPAAAEFYEFTKTMETYSEILGQDTTVILSTESDLFKYLKTMNPTPSVAPSVPSSVPNF